MQELYYDSDYVYLIHGTTRNASDINSFLEQGLINYYGPNLGATLAHIPSFDWYKKDPNLAIGNNQDLDERNYLETQIRNYTHFLYGNAMNVIVKIPLKWFDEENGKPIWRVVKPGGWGGNNVCALVPELIYGFYLCDTDEFIFNEKYGKIESFEGLEYDDDPWILLSYLDPIEIERLEKMKNADVAHPLGENSSEVNDSNSQSTDTDGTKKNKILSKLFHLKKTRNGNNEE